MTSIPVGLKGEHKQRVSPDIAVDFLGLEQARNTLLPLLDPGYDSVGTEVNVRHLAATPLGMEVTFKIEVIDAADRMVRFKVEAFDEKEQIADGTHARFIVHVERFARRLAEKQA